MCAPAPAPSILKITSVLSTLDNSAAEYAYRQYLLAAKDPDGAQNNVELVYDELYDSWRLYTGHQVKPLHDLSEQGDLCLSL
jgi:hypothetical protein